MMIRMPLLVLCVLALAACGDDTGGFYPDAGADVGTGGGGTDAGTGGGTDAGGGGGTDAGGGGGPTESCATFAGGGTTVSGDIYVDGDQSERSLWDLGNVGAGGDAMVGVPMRIIGADGITQGVSCDDGTWGFGDLSGDTWVVDVDWAADDLCRTRNCARHFGDAVAEGRVKIVTIGDSVPVVGDAPFFPERLGGFIAPLADVEIVNNAVGGTTSEDWVPGARLYEERLAPHIADADVIIVSIGGNDFLQYVNEGAASDPIGALNGVPDFVREVMGRVVDIKDEIRSINPNIDLVYLLYPNYATSDMWSSQFGFAASFIEGAVTDALEQILNELAVSEDIILVDFYGYFRETGLDLDDYLYDQLHFNDAGQEVYARQIFEALGGATTAGDPIGLETRYALEP
jgi:lysophospholipase L1-like esterase